jgi:hypothetical protein
MARADGEMKRNLEKDSPKISKIIFSAPDG